jgi:N utilization substance protein A
MESMATLNRGELLQIVETVAREKDIDREDVFGALEQAFARAAQLKYGQHLDIRASIDRRTGDINIARYREVVEEFELPEDEGPKIRLTEAKIANPAIELGEHVVDNLPPINFGRIAAQTAKQVVIQKVRDAERTKQFLEFKDRVGEIINGVVKRVEFGNVVVEVGRVEAMLRREELIQRETFRQGDRIRALIFDVREVPYGPQVFLSRVRPLMMARLFMQEVPEIYEGLIEIKAVSRDPGSRAKIAVYTRDPSIDPEGACIGVRGSRVQAVSGELKGERIDIIPWSEDAAGFVVNALTPAEVTKVIMDEENNRMEVVVPDEQLSIAIGRRGQNVRLASQLTGWNLDIMTETMEQERRQNETKTRSQLFVDALNVDEIVAHLLVGEGFTSIEEIIEVGIPTLAQIEGFDEGIAEELIRRAQAYIEKRDSELAAQLVADGMDAELQSFTGFALPVLAKLVKEGVKTVNDLADLASDELIDIIGNTVAEQDALDELIMQARARWESEAAAAPSQTQAQDEEIADTPTKTKAKAKA